MKLNIDGNEETDNLKSGTLEITKSLRNTSSATFALNRLPGENEQGIQNGLEVIIEDSQGNRIFGGTIDRVRAFKEIKRYKKIEVDCLGYAHTLNRRKIRAVYRQQNAGTILSDIITNRIPRENVQEGTIVEGPEIDEIAFNFESVSSAVDSLAQRAALEWAVDSFGNVHMFDEQGLGQAQKLDDSINVEPEEFEQNRDEFRNRQYIRVNEDQGEKTNAEKLRNRTKKYSTQLRVRQVEGGAGVTSDPIVNRAFGSTEGQVETVVEDEYGIDDIKAISENIGSAEEENQGSMSSIIELSSPLFFAESVKFKKRTFFSDSETNDDGINVQDLKVGYPEPDLDQINLLPWFGQEDPKDLSVGSSIYTPKEPFDILLWPGEDRILINNNTVDLGGNNTFIEVRYATEGNFTVAAQDSKSITDRKKIEPGSGVHARLRELNRSTTEKSAREFGKQIIDRFNEFAVSIRYSDYRAGRDIGELQKVKLDKFGVDDELIIGSITIRDTERKEGQTSGIGSDDLKREVKLIDKSRFRGSANTFEKNEDYQDTLRRESIVVPDAEAVQNDPFVDDDSGIIESVNASAGGAQGSGGSAIGSGDTDSGKSETGGAGVVRPGAAPFSDSAPGMITEDQNKDNDIGLTPEEFWDKELTGTTSTICNTQTVTLDDRITHRAFGIDKEIEKPESSDIEANEILSTALEAKDLQDEISYVDINEFWSNSYGDDAEPIEGFEGENLKGAAGAFGAWAAPLIQTLRDNDYTERRARTLWNTWIGGNQYNGFSTPQDIKDFIKDAKDGTYDTSKAHILPTVEEFEDQCL